MLNNRYVLVGTHVLLACLVSGITYFVCESKFEQEVDQRVATQTQHITSQVQALHKKIDGLDTALTYTQKIDNALCMNIFGKDAQAIDLKEHEVNTTTKSKKNTIQHLLAHGLSRVSNIAQTILQQQQFYSQIFELFKQKSLVLAETPAVNPVSLNEGHFSSGYGERRDPFIDTLVAFHGGIDFSAPQGTPIYATADGMIKRAEDKGDGYGNCVEIEHTGTGYLTKYAHMSKMNVATEQKVKRGDIIGFVGSTGRSTGAHCHYEVYKNGERLNPAPYTNKF